MKIRMSLLFLPMVLFVVGWAAEGGYGMDGAVLTQSSEPPVIPVGLDAYRMWDKLCYHRIGIRAYMRSTYDREGNNRTADASQVFTEGAHYLASFMYFFRRNLP